MNTRTSPSTLTVTALCSLAVIFSWPQASAISFSIDATSPSAPPPDDILVPGPALILPGLSAFDVNGISYGHAHTSFPLVAGFAFSVDRVSGGIPGSATFTESGGGPTFGEQSADVYAATIAVPGTNAMAYDGDGLFPPGAGGPPLGLIEVAGGAPTDNLNALDLRSPPAVGVIFWTADAITLPGSSADIFITAAAPGYTAAPPAYVLAGTLGLGAADDIDALAVFDDGDGIYGAADTILFSLARGSPALGGLGLSPGDVLIASGGGPVAAVPFATAGSLGLTPGDNLDALDTVFIPEPSSFLLVSMGFACLLLCHRRWLPY